MRPLYVLDTHTALWAMTADPRLGAEAKNVVLEPTSDLVFPAIAVAEAVAVIQAGRSRALIGDLWDFAFRTANVRFQPLDEAVLRQSETVRDIPEMHDRLIVATTLVLESPEVEATLLTRDKVISAAGLVKTLW